LRSRSTTTSPIKRAVSIDRGLRSFASHAPASAESRRAYDAGACGFAGTTSTDNDTATMTWFSSNPPSAQSLVNCGTAVARRTPITNRTCDQASGLHGPRNPGRTRVTTRTLHDHVLEIIRHIVSCRPATGHRYCAAFTLPHSAIDRDFI
jgi:hypothetical protein